MSKECFFLGLSAKKGVKSITKIQDWQDDPMLFNYCLNKKILSIIPAFVGPNAWKIIKQYTTLQVFASEKKIFFITDQMHEKS